MSPLNDVREPDRATFVDLNRTRLRLWEWGDVGSPPIICAHGAYDHGRMFDGIAAQLADDGYHVLVPDLRGHGDSGPISTGHIFDAAVIDLGTLAVAQAGPVGLVGHSMGASMLFSVAATWPELVPWVVSFDGLGPPRRAFAEMSLEMIIADSMGGLLKVLGRSRRVFDDVDALVAQRGSINTRMPPYWVEHLARHGSVSTADGVAWKWDPMMNTGLPEGFDESWVTIDLEDVRCPALAVMGAAEDVWSFPTDEVAERAEHFPNLEYTIVSDAGHYVHLEQPEVVIGLVREFLDRVHS